VARGPLPPHVCCYCPVFSLQSMVDVILMCFRGVNGQFLVIIIVDGREKMSKSVAEFAEKELKVWDSSMLKYEHRNNEVTCHIFEKTVDLPKHSSQREYYKPLQIVMAVKEKNGGKLNSHLWYFSAFAKQLQPDYVFVRAILSRLSWRTGSDLSVSRC
jgi:cellulose synthase/poly-beta-1,6-N-acetylglucosamine synthase-like glycosyltransferase